MSSERRVALIDGCRTPFLRSGTDYKDLLSYDLGRHALKGLLHRTEINPESVEHVTVGTVVSEVTTSNVAREITIAGGLPQGTPADTVTMACISANKAITNTCDLIRTGQANVAIAGGTDSVSAFPIRYKRAMRKRLFAAQKYRSVWDFRKFFSGFRLGDLLPEIPNITEFSTKLSMGQSCDRMAARIGVTREEQDDYAIRSHQLAAKASEEGNLEEIYPVRLGPKYKTIAHDNGIRGDSNYEKLSKLRPAFVRKYGSITAANASFLTDGAAMVLLMEAEKAKEMGYTPKAYIRDYVYTAHDPLEELLLGPAYAIPKVLEQSGLTLDDIDVFEFHEAFAGQILSAIRCLASDDFAKEKLGRDQQVGDIPIDKLNTWGGSLSIGHPFGATGARIVTAAANRLQKEDGKYALIASCAAGAMAHAMIIERA